MRPAWGQGRHFHMFEGTPPLGLAYVAAALIEAGHDVSVTDAVLDGWDNVMPYGPMVARGLSNREVVRRIPSDAAVVGVSVMSTTDWPLVVDLCDRIAAARPDVAIILGGEHPSAVPEFCLRTSRARVVVLGEGEVSAVEVVGALATPGLGLGDVRGIAFLDGERYVETAARARVRDLESLPRPAWHLFDIHAYQRRRFVGGALWQGRRSLPMLASRGCPYQCTFCTSPQMWAPLWVPRDPAAVVDEMVFLRDTYGVTDFSLHDLTTVVRRSWVLDLCREITARGLDVSWQLHSGTRLEEIDDELLAHMRRAGLGYLVLAPESASEATRERVKKRMRTSDIVRAVRASVASGIPVKVQVMTGLPGDGHEDAWQNFGFACWLGREGVDAVGTAVFAPYPGTQLFDELLESGEIELGEDLIFFPVANNDFSRPLLRSQRIGPRATKAWQLATLAGFVGAKFMFHPGVALRSLGRALTSEREAAFFDKLLKALLTAGFRVLVSPCNGEPVTWAPIDYARFTPTTLSRRRRMSVGPKPVVKLDPPWARAQGAAPAASPVQTPMVIRRSEK